MTSMLIQCFLDGSKLNSFTDAASALHISQPAFSRNIAPLEDEWDMALFLCNNEQKSKNKKPDGSYSVVPTGQMTAMIDIDLDVTIKVRQTAERLCFYLIQLNQFIDLKTFTNPAVCVLYCRAG